MAKLTAEQIFRGMLRGPLTTRATSASNQWAGRTTSVGSGTATVTVSTTSVKSDSIIMYGYESNVASNATQAIKTNSVVDGSYFGFTINPAPVGTNFIVMWKIINTN